MYDLFEVDWVCISDYLDIVHTPSLHWLSASSNGLSWYVRPKIVGLSWVCLLHHLDSPLQRSIVELMPQGKLKNINELIQEDGMRHRAVVQHVASIC